MAEQIAKNYGLKFVVEGWNEDLDSGKRYYLKEGKRLTGLQKIGKDYYLFSTRDGRRLVGKQRYGKRY